MHAYAYSHEEYTWRTLLLCKIWWNRRRSFEDM